MSLGRAEVSVRRKVVVRRARKRIFVGGRDEDRMRFCWVWVKREEPAVVRVGRR